MTRRIKTIGRMVIVAAKRRDRRCKQVGRSLLGEFVARRLGSHLACQIENYKASKYRSNKHCDDTTISRL